MDSRIQIAVDYVRSQRATGVSDDAISAALLQIGWPQDYVTAAFNNVGQPPPVQTAQPTALADQPVVATPAQAGASQPTDTRQKYTIRAAIADVYRGIKVNWLTYLICVASLIVSAFLIGLLITLVVGPIAAHNPNLLKPSLGMILGVLVAALIFYCLANALTVSLLSLILRDGLDGHRGKPLATLKTAVSRFIRVALANGLVAVVAAGPYIVSAVLILVFAFGAGSSGGKGANITILILGILLMLAGTAWAIITWLRFALAPYIALIEPQLPLRSTLKRSYTLLRKGGQWFLIKGFLIVLLLALILAGISGGVEKMAGSGNAVVTILNIVVTILVDGAIYTLYRNRVAVKK